MIPLAIMLAVAGYLLLWTAFKGKEYDYNPATYLAAAFKK